MAVAPKAKFIFDPRGLPPELSTAQSQTAFAAAVTAEVRQFGVNGDTDQVKNNIAVTIGTLIRDGRTNVNAPGFGEAIYNAYKVGLEFYRKDQDVNDLTRNQELYDKIVSVLVASGTGLEIEIAYQEVAAIASYIINNPNRYPLNNSLIANQIGVGRDRYVDGAPPADSLTLPPLTGSAGEHIEFEGPNIEAVGVCYLGMQLDRMGLVAVVDRLTELNQLGLLSLRYGSASKALDDWHWNAEDRLNQPSRMSVYGRVCGMAGAPVSKEVQPNVNFESLLTRFIATIVESDRQERVTNLIEPARARSLALTDEMVRKAGRDLASGASLYGWSGTQLQARRIKTTMLDALQILSLPEILSLYAATSPYQVIERVSSEEFKQVPNVVKLRTMAEAGHAILRLVANNLNAWAASPSRPLFETVPGAGDGDISQLVRREFLIHANSYAAVVGLNDAQIDKSSQPADMPYSPSIPQIGGGVAAMPAAGTDDTLNRLRQMMTSGTMPTQDQLKSLLSVN